MNIFDQMRIRRNFETMKASEPGTFGREPLSPGDMRQQLLGRGPNWSPTGPATPEQQQAWHNLDSLIPSTPHTGLQPSAFALGGNIMPQQLAAQQKVAQPFQSSIGHYNGSDTSFGSHVENPIRPFEARPGKGFFDFAKLFGR